MLAMASPVFKAMLTTEASIEKTTGQAKIKDISAETLLDHVYGKGLEYKGMTVQRMMKLLYAADRYVMSSLKDECAECIVKKIDASNAVDILNNGLSLKIIDVITAASGFIKEHPKEVV